MKTLFQKHFLILISLLIIPSVITSQNTAIWEIGSKDNSAAEFALYPSGYKDFLEHNFGFEDEFFLINHSEEKKNFPYVLPGPVDTWGGTYHTAGWRTHEINTGVFSATKYSRA